MIFSRLVSGPKGMKQISLGQKVHRNLSADSRVPFGGSKNTFRDFWKAESHTKLVGTFRAASPVSVQDGILPWTTPTDNAHFWHFRQFD